MNIGQPSLDHLRAFLAIVEEGSFNRAAQKLGRPISVVSYAVATLEAQLGLSLFDREGSRRPQLTAAGQALLVDARATTNGADALLARVRSLHQGLEAELSLVVDVMLPSDVLARVLRDFQRMFPSVALRLHVEALGAVAALVLDGQASLGISGPLLADSAELDWQLIGAISLIPVAAPGHPLAGLKSITLHQAREHVQLVLSDRSPLTQGRDFSVISPRSWRLADLGAKHALLREGIGWGNMPRHSVAEDLARGRLVELALPESRFSDYRFNALWRKDVLPGPATSWALEAFRDQLAACPQEEVSGT